jgi:hypothetical protein
VGVPGIDLDDEAVVGEVGVDLEALDGSVHRRSWETVAVAEGEEPLFVL